MQNRDDQRNEQGREGGDDALSSNSEGTPIYLTPDSTLQTPEEDRHDKENDPRKDDTFSVSNDDLHDTKGSRLGGSDRAGTSERKEN
jgi:hypothetical protein